MMVVQAAAAEQVMPGEPDRAREALEAVQETGRAAVVELSRVLFVLRQDDTDSVALALSSTVRSAGLRVDLDVLGDLDDLPPAFDLDVYRVVQEGLTNAVKHAPGTHVRVRPQRSSSTVQIEVGDTGPSSRPVDATSGGTGLGLIGLRSGSASSAVISTPARAPVGASASPPACP